MRASPASACIVTLLAASGCAPQPAPEPAATASSSGADNIRAVSFTDVQLQDAFWKPRFERNRDVTIPHIMEQNELTGRVDNFRKAAGLIALIGAAQQDDGYLFPALTTDPENPALGVGTERWMHVSAGSHELYNAGSIGARGTFESFGEDYELPNRAYGETCAAVGFAQWNHRMFLATGDVEFLDVMERTLYSGLLAGVSQQGDTFF